MRIGRAGLATRAIHAGERPDPATHAHQAADLCDRHVRLRYRGREGGRRRPGAGLGTRRVLLLAHRQPDEPGARGEDRVARRRRGCVVSSSGMAAVSATLFAHLAAGDHLVVGDELFVITGVLLDEDFPRRDIEVTRVDMTDLGGGRRRDHAGDAGAVPRDLDEPAAARRRSRCARRDRPPPRAPVHRRQHVPRAGPPPPDRARRRPRPPRGHEVPVRPRRRGVGRRGRLEGPHRPDPQADRHARPGGQPVRELPGPCAACGRSRCDRGPRRPTRRRIAAFLEGHPKVEWVRYPGLASHPDHAVARRLLGDSGGAMLTFQPVGGLDGMAAFTDHLACATSASASATSTRWSTRSRSAAGSSACRSAARTSRTCSRTSSSGCRSWRAAPSRPNAAAADNAAPIVRSTRRVTSSSGGRYQASAPSLRVPSACPGRG